MAAVDIVFLAVITLSLLMGMLRGFVKEALSLIAWVAAIVVATVLSPHLADRMTGLMDSASLRAVAAFAILFVGTVFFGALISNLFSRLTSAVGLGGTDRVLGGLFGILRGVLVIVLVVFLTQPFDFTRQWYQDSLLVPHVVELSEYLQSLIGVDSPAPSARTVSAIDLQQRFYHPCAA